MTKITLISYNNYFNRIIKSLPSINDFKLASRVSPLTVEAINFNYNDNVNTTHVINTPLMNANFDYAIITNDQDEIESKWFIVDSAKIRGKQFKLVLRRDLLADYYNEVLDSTCYIQKGMLPLSNILITNKEGLEVNEIKKEEILLKDRTQVGWYAIYLDKNINSETEGLSISSRGGIPDDYIEIPSSWGWIEKQGTYQVVVPDTSNRMIFEGKYNSPSHPRDYREDSFYFTDGTTYNLALNSEVKRYSSEVNFHDYLTNNLQPFELTEEMKSSAASLIEDILLAYSGTDFSTILTENPIEEILQYNGKIVKIGTTFYHVNATSGPRKYHKIINIDNSFSTRINSLISQFPGFVSKVNNKNGTIDLWYKEFQFFLTIAYDLNVNFTLDHTKLKTNALYNLILIPAKDLHIKNGSNTYISADPINAINTIAHNLQSHVYDIQYLPYCPNQDAMNELAFDLSKLYAENYQLIVSSATGNNKCLLLYYIEDPKFSFEIEAPYQVPTDPLEFKVVNESTKFRLCSPNYNGVFEFSPTLNLGVSKYKIDCLYQPNSPYIHVQPYFNGLYGSDFSDIRGLICQGDFSLPRIDDKFLEYQIQNKNYSALFDRTIENMEVQRKAQKSQQLINMIAGVGGSTASGAVSGFLAGGPGGAAAGAIIGGGASLAGGILDIAQSNKLYEENKDFAIDRYNLQLGNIKALPYSITKSCPFTQNYKIFPFIEIYSCSDEEIEWIRNKIRYNGMLIGTIGRPLDYINSEILSFIQAELIRIESIDDDTHLISEISNELKKGVYYELSTSI